MRPTPLQPMARRLEASAAVRHISNELGRRQHPSAGREINKGKSTTHANNKKHTTATSAQRMCPASVRSLWFSSSRFICQGCLLNGSLQRFRSESEQLIPPIEFGVPRIAAELPHGQRRAAWRTPASCPEPHCFRRRLTSWGRPVVFPCRRCTRKPPPKRAPPPRGRPQPSEAPRALDRRPELRPREARSALRRSSLGGSGEELRQLRHGPRPPRQRRHEAPRSRPRLQHPHENPPLLPGPGRRRLRAAPTQRFRRATARDPGPCRF